MACPDCRHERERSLTEGEKVLLTGKAAPFAREAMICGYCGTVFVPGKPPRLLGDMDSTSGPGYVPRQGYS